MKQAVIQSFILTVCIRCNIYDNDRNFLFKTVDYWLPTSLFVEWKKAMESYLFFNSTFIVFTGNSTLRTPTPLPQPPWNGKRSTPKNFVAVYLANYFVIQDITYGNIGRGWGAELNR